MSRRAASFLTRLGLSLAAAGCGLFAIRSAAADVPEVAAFGTDARILFQGDSITDGNRGRSADPNHILGHGYCFIVAAQYGAAFPERHLTFLNRGISGNTVLDLQARVGLDEDEGQVGGLKISQELKRAQPLVAHGARHGAGMVGV